MKVKDQEIERAIREDRRQRREKRKKKKKTTTTTTNTNNNKRKKKKRPRTRSQAQQTETQTTRQIQTPTPTTQLNQNRNHFQQQIEEEETVDIINNRMEDAQHHLQEEEEEEREMQEEEDRMEDDDEDEEEIQQQQQQQRENEEENEEEEEIEIEDDMVYRVEYQIETRANEQRSRIQIIERRYTPIDENRVFNEIYYHEEEYDQKQKKLIKIIDNDDCEKLEKEVPDVRDLDRAFLAEWTLLIRAAYKKANKCIKWLLNKGANIEIRGEKRKTALMTASKFNNLETIELLLEHGARVESRNSQGWTACHYAAAMGHKDALELLVDKGKANFNVTELEEWTPLMMATDHNHVECMKYLLEIGADIKARDDCQRTVLHLASSVESLKLLLHYGADPSIVDQTNFTPLHFVTLRKNAKMLKILVKLDNVDVNHQSTDGKSCLHIAAKHNDEKCLKLLLDAHANIELRNNNGKTALHYTACFDNVESARMLLDYGADVNSLDEDGWTPAHIAANFDKPKCLSLFCDRGALVNKLDKQQAPPIMYAIQKKHFECLKILLDYGADVTIRVSDVTVLHFLGSFSESIQDYLPLLKHVMHAPGGVSRIFHPDTQTVSYQLLGVDTTPENAAYVAPLARAVLSTRDEMLNQFHMYNR